MYHPLSQRLDIKFIHSSVPKCLKDLEVPLEYSASYSFIEILHAYFSIALADDLYMLFSIHKIKLDTLRSTIKRYNQPKDRAKF